MPRTLAKGRRRVDFLATADKPADWTGVTTTEIGAALALTCSIARNDFNLGFTDSDTVDDPALCEVINSKTLDASNAQAKFSIYRFLDTDGKSDSTNDAAWTTLGEKGVQGWLLERTDPLPLATTAWAAGDKGIAYPVVTDNPQPPQDETGWLKRVIPFAVTGDPIKFTVATT